MKKLIAILAVMIVLAGVVFAATNDKLVLSSTVSKVRPNFKIYLGDQAGVVAGTTVAIEEDISEDDVTRSFLIKQADSIVVGDANNTTKNYAKFKGTATLTVEIGPFKNTTLEAESSVYEITAITKGAGVTNKLTIADGTIADGAHSASIVLSYLGKKVLDTEVNTGTNMVAKIDATWTADDTLPVFNGDTATVYTADIKLTYTVQ